MRQKPQTLPVVLLLLLVAAGQSMSVFSAVCSMGLSAPGQNGSAEPPPVEIAMDMSHAHHAMADSTDETSTENCCGDEGDCLMAQCTVPSGALNTQTESPEFSPSPFLVQVSFPILDATVFPRFRPPIFA
jgi:hypothetical protein